MNHEICESCGLKAPHKKEDCFQELVRSKKLADELFSAALEIEVFQGDPVKIKKKKLQNAAVSVAVASWRYAI